MKPNCFFGKSSPGININLSLKDWTADDRFNISDFNRIKENLSKLFGEQVKIGYSSYDDYISIDDISTYTGVWIVDDFNKLEKLTDITINSNKSNKEVYPKTYYAGGQFVTYDHLNEIEEACSRRRELLMAYKISTVANSSPLGMITLGKDFCI